MGLLVPPAQAGQTKTSEKPRTLLFIRTMPPGAKVLADGKLLGRSDDLFAVEPGIHKIEVQLDGYDSQTKDVTIPSGEVTRLEWQLRKRPGELAFKPVVEITTKDLLDATGQQYRNRALDFDTGRFYEIPEEFSSGAMDDIEKRFAAWCRTSGADARVSGFHFRLYDGLALKVRDKHWDATPEQVRSEMSRDTVEFTRTMAQPTLPRRATAAEAEDARLPHTYFFKTREGGLGVLQLYKVGDETRARYKMAKAPAR